jgi:hypothetical protein
MRSSCLILIIFTGSSSLAAQQNRIKLGFIGFPSVSGFGIGDIGYERLNKKLNASWQLHFSASGGAVATDVGTETRKWGTIEKTFYRNTISKRITWSYSFFAETGSREKSPGKGSNTPEKFLITTKWFEINPGASLGIQFRIGKKWGIETQAGPKFIFATGKEYYRNSVINQTFTESINNNRAGFRLVGGFTYQF